MSAASPLRPSGSGPEAKLPNAARSSTGLIAQKASGASLSRPIPTPISAVQSIRPLK